MVVAAKMECVSRLVQVFGVALAMTSNPDCAEPMKRKTRA